MDVAAFAQSERIKLPMKFCAERSFQIGNTKSSAAPNGWYFCFAQTRIVAHIYSDILFGWLRIREMEMRERILKGAQPVTR